MHVDHNSKSLRLFPVRKLSLLYWSLDISNVANKEGHNQIILYYYDLYPNVFNSLLLLHRYEIVTFISL